MKSALGKTSESGVMDKLRKLEREDGRPVRLSLPGISVGFVLNFVVALAAAAAATIGLDVYGQLSRVPNLAYLDQYHPLRAIEIYDRDNALVCSINPGIKQTVVPIDKISPKIQQAVVAVEDQHFFEHGGINPTSILRASLANLQAGKVVEGGSTITQQLAKNLFFQQSGRNMTRKISEALVAYDIERRFDKRQILKIYLNEIYFGNGAYGAEQAARTYFGKPASQVDTAEAAFLAGLIKSPSYLGALKNRSEALERQRVVLKSMRDHGFITEDQFVEFTAKPLRFAATKDVPDRLPFERYPYFTSYILSVSKNLIQPMGDSEIKQRGLRIYTTLDQSAQKAAEDTLKKAVERAPKPIDQGAVVTLSVSDGSISALVGGVGNFWENQWNCATNPHTAGSSFKPFVYLTAFMEGLYKPDSKIDDLPLTVREPGAVPYTPKNFDRRFMGKIPIDKAIAQSRNVCAIRVAQEVGIKKVIDTARYCGIESRLDPNLSLALGSAAVSPLEMASAYGTLAREGIFVRPWSIRRIETMDGDVVHDHTPASYRVLEKEPVAQIVECLTKVVESGTGTLAKMRGFQVAGKTGTADGSTDLWFVGFTSDVVSAVWLGSEEHRSVDSKYVTGGTLAARVWRDMTQLYYASHPTISRTLTAMKMQTEKQTRHSADSYQAVSGSEIESRRSYGQYTAISGANRGSVPEGATVVRSQGGVTDYQWTEAPPPGPQSAVTPASEVKVELAPPMSVEVPLVGRSPRPSPASASPPQPSPPLSLPSSPPSSPPPALEPSMERTEVTQ